MLSVFPHILFLSPFSATLLRAAAGIIFLMLAWNHCTRRKELSDVPFIVVGRGGWIPLLASTLETLVGIALIAGVYTQVAALVGALLALKSFVWHRQYPQFFPLSRTTAALLFVICVSLLVTGAGPFAFDLPL
jgi:uncharacterized membrane protein YphA (DoxX/SURF4 family)